MAVGFRIKMLWMLQPVFKHRRGIVAPEVFLADGYGRHPEGTGSNGLLDMPLDKAVGKSTFASQRMEIHWLLP